MVTSIKIDILDKEDRLSSKKRHLGHPSPAFVSAKKAAPKNRRTLFQIIKLSIFH